MRTGCRIAIVQGHPDSRAAHYCHGLARAYAQAARESGHEVRAIDVAQLDFPLLRSARQWQQQKAPPAILKAQGTIAWAQHLVIVFPLWLGDMPAVLKAFFEQALRPGFAVGEPARGGMPAKLLKGRSARIVVTMGMPAFFYRLYYRAHSVRSLKRNVLQMCGISPVGVTLLGTVEGKQLGVRELGLAKMAMLGRDAR
jgi:putative NADPH-quinone reductase